MILSVFPPRSLPFFPPGDSYFSQIRGEFSFFSLPRSLSVSIFLLFLRWLQDATRPVGIQSRMAFYKCKFLIKVGVGLQIRKEAKFPQCRSSLRRDEGRTRVERALKEGKSGEGGRVVGLVVTKELRRVTSAATAATAAAT